MEGKVSPIDKRISILLFFIIIFGAAIIFRLFFLQVIQHSFYLSLAQERQEVLKSLIPQRGSIYVRENGELYSLVTNREYFLVYAEPAKISDVGKVIDRLTPILNLEEKEWKELLVRISKKNDPYEPVKHKVTKKQVEELEKLNLAGIGFLPETYRFYPEKGLGSHIFGFVGIGIPCTIGALAISVVIIYNIYILFFCFFNYIFYK